MRIMKCGRRWRCQGSLAWLQQQWRKAACLSKSDHTTLVHFPCSVRCAPAKRFKKVENATALIWKILQVAESTFRRLKGAELLPAVYAGAQYVMVCNGLRASAADGRLTRAQTFSLPRSAKGVKRQYAVRKLWV